MDKTYDPHSIERRLRETWENKHYFAPEGQGKPYCIMLPPPNVTGRLHMGHGFGFTLMDILIRYHRMSGDNTLWQPGTDHAGIATQMVVEKQLMLQGKSRHDLGRDAFVEKVWAWKEESGSSITQQLRRLGASLDWSREKFTLDESLSQAVQEVFVKLYDEGLIYRGTRLVNWDPVLLTAISDLEVLSEEEDCKLWHIRYPLTDQSGHLTIATTRPETLLGDVAVAVHPDDERYRHLIGKSLQLPLTDRQIPIIADTYVDPAFGSGCVKITPAHDFNDYAVGERHHLTPINIFTPTAHINDNAPKNYRGLERFKARAQIIKDLEFLGLVEKIEKHKAKIPRGEKSDAIIEPYLTPQWFIKIESLAAPAIQAVERGEIRFIPENWSKTYYQWMHNIQDWCISRQLWWGHRIPAWYDAKGNIYVGKNEAEIRKKYQLTNDIVLTQDEDVLDTWFSSALWPFSSLGWPENTKDLATFYPTNVLVTGFDIIFFWVARMIMMGLKFTGQVPFREVYITGLIRDAEGHKMSKSKGNVLDPIDLIDGISLDELLAKRTYGLMQPAMAQKIEKNTRQQFPDGISSYGTDALRFTFTALATYGREIRFDVSRLDGYRNFCNKIWNAARYVLMNAEGKDIVLQREKLTFSLPDRWILSRLQKTINDTYTHLKNYRFDLMAHVLYEFTWNEFCDWYLELSKPILTSTTATPAELWGTRFTLLTVLETLLRLLHPIMPFITEEIWQRIAPMVGKTGDTIMLQPFPLVDKTFENTDAENEIHWVKNIIIAIRTIRSEMNVSPAKVFDILLRKGNVTDKQYVAQHLSFITSLAKLSSITWPKDDDKYPECATTFVGDMEILIPMAGLIDKKEETERLNRESLKIKKEIERAMNKLQNASFVDKAPKEVVEQEQNRLNEFKTILTKLESQLEKINKM